MKVKNFFKKAAVVTMAVVMTVTFAACGSNGGNEGGDAEGAFKIGGSGPLTGPASLYGQAVQNGAQIAVDEINAGDGYKIEFNMQDDEADGEKGVNAYNKLKDWGVQVVMGAVTTGSCIAVAAETNADRVFELTPSASSADVTAGKDNVFQMCFTDPNQGKTAAQYIAKNFAGKKVAAIVNQSDAYSTGIFNAFKAEFQAQGGQLVAEEYYPDDTNTDYSAQINKCKAAGAEVVFLPIYYTPASIIFKQAKDADYAPTFFGVDGMDGILSLENFDTSLAEGVMLMTPFNPYTTGKDFADKYTAKYGAETLNQFAADGYDCIYSIYEALNATGCTPDMSAADMCDKMIEYFTTKISYNGLTGKSMTWSTNGEVSKDPMVVVIKDGAYADL